MAEMQRRKIGSRAFPAFLSGQVGQPAVIVLQEWWGVTDMIKEHALKIAAQGYRVLIPDVYKGKLGVDKEEAHHLMSNLDFPAAVVEIGDAASYLKEEGAPHVGVADDATDHERGVMTSGMMRSPPTRSRISRSRRPTSERSRTSCASDSASAWSLASRAATPRSPWPR